MFLLYRIIVVLNQFGRIDDILKKYEDQEVDWVEFDKCLILKHMQWFRFNTVETYEKPVSQRRVIQEDEAENSLNQSSSNQSSSNQSSNAHSVKPIPKKKTTVVRPKIKKSSKKNEKNEKVMSPISRNEVELAKIEKHLNKIDLIMVIWSLREWIKEEHYGDDFLQHLEGKDVDLFQSMIASNVIIVA